LGYIFRQPASEQQYLLDQDRQMYDERSDAIPANDHTRRTSPRPTPESIDVDDARALEI